MTQTEALRLALEALEEYASVVTSVNDPNTWIKVADGGKPAREAITAIKAALEAKGEPVAWIEHHKGGDNLVWDDPSGKRTPLYTTPPQRKPLTDEEIEELDMETSGTVHDFVRAIEAAHGIKGEA